MSQTHSDAASAPGAFYVQQPDAASTVSNLSQNSTTTSIDVSSYGSHLFATAPVRGSNRTMCAPYGSHLYNHVEGKGIDWWDNFFTKLVLTADTDANVYEATLEEARSFVEGFKQVEAHIEAIEANIDGQIADLDRQYLRQKEELLAQKSTLRK